MCVTLLRLYCSTVSNFYCYFIHFIHVSFTVISMISGICSSVISFLFVCVMLQFQLCCCIAQLHCNTSAIVIGHYLLTYLLTYLPLRGGYLNPCVQPAGDGGTRDPIGCVAYRISGGTMRRMQSLLQVMRLSGRADVFTHGCLDQGVWSERPAWPAGVSLTMSTSQLAPLWPSRTSDAATTRGITTRQKLTTLQCN